MAGKKILGRKKKEDKSGRENGRRKEDLEMKIERLEKEVAEMSESSFYLKQEKEENRKVISELVNGD